MGLIPAFKKLRIDCGYYTTEENTKSDCLRIKHSDHKSMERVKKRRKQLRVIKTGLLIRMSLRKEKHIDMGNFNLFFISTF